jgi:hypothetical protein
MGRYRNDPAFFLTEVRMATVGNIIKRALGKLNAFDSGEALPSADSSDAIDNLNTMMTRWEADGLASGWVNVANPSDDMPTPPELDGAIVWNLAIELAPDYDMEPSQVVVNRAGIYMAALERDRYVEAPIYSENDAPMGSGMASWSNYYMKTGGFC